MPSYGEYQKPAGVKLNCGCADLGTRTMKSNNMMVKTTLRIDNVPYKGNAVLNANK
mgnify:FL=1|jgi:hypothetical protein|tara:strand:+ start:180 stop:347 length:168 start_codon:yes stop_codon:yes gene_type:complete